MKSAILAAAASTFLLCQVNAQAQAPPWGQCGGIGWPGPTICQAGQVCTYLNAYHYQCITVTTTTSDSLPTSPPPTTSTIAPVM